MTTFNTNYKMNGGVAKKLCNIFRINFVAFKYYDRLRPLNKVGDVMYVKSLIKLLL